MPIHPCDRCQPIRSAITGTGIDGTAPATPPIRGSNGSTVDGFGTNLLPSGVWSAVPTIGVMGDVTWMAVVGAAVILLALGFSYYFSGADQTSAGPPQCGQLAAPFARAPATTGVEVGAASADEDSAGTTTRATTPESRATAAVCHKPVPDQVGKRPTIGM